jgi:Na+-transporting NADH:ubiquinone oxidoreductase subunit A
MKIHTIKKGLFIPLTNEVTDFSIQKAASGEYALLAEDFPYLKPRLAVKEGESVKAGQALLFDKNLNELAHISPVSGKVKQIIRGDKRAFIGIVVSIEDGEPFSVKMGSSTRDEICATLIDSGLWTSIKSRPFGSVANPALSPSAIFITAMDTRPYAANVDAVLGSREGFFEKGVRILSKLTEGKVYICKDPGSLIPEIKEANIETAGFSGSHPAGLAGTHIHFLRPVNREKHVWEVDYQEVIAIGELFETGKANFKRVISFAGEGVAKPALIETIVGANALELAGKFEYDKAPRLISGSILYGSQITEGLPWMGRFDRQLVLLQEGKKSILFSWLTFGPKLFSAKRIFVSHIKRPSSYHFDTAMRGSNRSMVPVGSYEKVMPLDIMITLFLRYLSAGDNEMLEKLGALELLEEDLSLVTYVSPEKTDFGPLLRQTLDAIRVEVL